MASSILCIMHQSLGQFGLQAKFVLADAGSQTATIRNLIRESHIGQINTVADQQFAQLIQNVKVQG